MDVHGTARPGTMTFTRLSTVMNTLLCVSSEEQEGGGRERRGSGGEVLVDGARRKLFLAHKRKLKRCAIFISHFNKALYMKIESNDYMQYGRSFMAKTSNNQGF